MEIFNLQSLSKNLYAFQYSSLFFIVSIFPMQQTVKQIALSYETLLRKNTLFRNEEENDDDDDKDEKEEKEEEREDDEEEENEL